MALSISELIKPLLISFILILILEIISTTVSPIFFSNGLQLEFHLLFVIFLGFRMTGRWMAPTVFSIQFFHSLFSIEGWALGTFTGIIICLMIGRLKEMISLSNNIVTMLVTFGIQLVWFFLKAGMLVLKVETFPFLERFWLFLPQGIILSLLSPFLFKLLNDIWEIGHENTLGNEA